VVTLKPPPPTAVLQEPFIPGNPPVVHGVQVQVPRMPNASVHLLISTSTYRATWVTLSTISAATHISPKFRKVPRSSIYMENLSVHMPPRTLRVPVNSPTMKLPKKLRV